MAESRIKDENFYQIQGWMINRLGLKGVPLNVYAIVYGFSQDGENEYTGSLQYLCDFCGGVSKPTVINALKALVECGYLLRREEVINGVQFNKYKANLPLLKNLYSPDKENAAEGVKKFNGGGKKNLPNNEVDIGVIKKIIEYLNSKLGTRYSPTTAGTQKNIRARFAEKADLTVEDFFSVIDKKCAEWKGTDMEKYLRPETLFGNKFENYLNAPASVRPTKGTGGVAVAQDRKTDLDEVF